MCWITSRSRGVSASSSDSGWGAGPVMLRFRSRLGIARDPRSPAVPLHAPHDRLPHTMPVRRQRGRVEAGAAVAHVHVHGIGVRLGVHVHRRARPELGRVRHRLPGGRHERLEVRVELPLAHHDDLHGHTVALLDLGGGSLERRGERGGLSRRRAFRQPGAPLRAPVAWRKTKPAAITSATPTPVRDMAAAARFTSGAPVASAVSPRTSGAVAGASGAAAAVAEPRQISAPPLAISTSGQTIASENQIPSSRTPSSTLIRRSPVPAATSRAPPHEGGVDPVAAGDAGADAAQPAGGTVASHAPLILSG